MTGRLIKLRLQNGLNFEGFKKEVLHIEGLNKLYHFTESDNPDFVIFGPYGNDIPPKGAYTRIGYFCENIKPDFSICEWAFGIPREEDINQPNYKRILWHGISSDAFIKHPVDETNPPPLKTKFCNFLYSHRVPYREEFFNQLSKYKKVDAPGRSMKNMDGIDRLYNGDKWEIKKQFLSSYKFTIAFENDIFPGYQTEKLYDAMLAGSIPIYCGDPFASDIFNTNSFIDALEYLPQKSPRLINTMEQLGHMDFEDIRPAYLKAPRHRLKRKAKAYVRKYTTKFRFRGADFKPLIDRIIEIDNSPELYRQYTAEPWLQNNVVPENLSARNRWIEIFNSR